MKIPHKLITELGSSYYGFIEHKYIALLIIILLHHNKKINDERLKAFFKSLKNNTLLRRINTYHCKINNTWYNDTSMYEVLLEVYNDNCPKNDIDLNTFLKYLNQYFNANKNFCLNAVYFHYIEPLIENFANYPANKIIPLFGLVNENEIMTYDQAESRGLLSNGYCCEDCDGCYTQYKQSQYQFYYFENAKKEITNTFKNYLLNQKTHQRNLNDRLK